MAITLRNYQVNLIDETRDRLRSHRRVLLQAPTGAGKTGLASFMAGETSGRGRVVFFICHRAELVFQTCATFRKFGIGHGVVAAGYPMDLGQLVQVCSIDTLKNRLHMLPRPALVIWDECHHVAAAGWAAVMEHFSQAFHIGLTATPCRLDGTGLDDYFETMVLGPAVSWLIQNGFLSEYELYAPSAPDMAGVRKIAGEYAKGETAARADKPKLIGDAIKHWRRHADGLQTVAFCVNRDHSRHTADLFNRAGIPAAHLDGGTKRAERQQIIQDYAAGRILVLTNVALFGEGFDLAAIAQRDVTIDCLVDLAPTNSLGWAIQKWGRVLRPKEGKVGVILDHAGNSDRHGLPDDEREWTLEGRAKGTRAANDNGPPPPITCEGCFRQIRRPAPDRCPSCGHDLRPKVREIEAAEGELVRVTEAERQKKQAARQASMEQATAKNLQDLVQLAVKRGYANPQKWAWKVWSNRNNKQRRYG